MLNKFSQRVPLGEKKILEKMPSWLLVLVCVSSFLFVAYIGLMFADVIPELIDVTNEEGLSNKPAILLWLCLGYHGVFFWIVTCITKKCHDLLYSRWFK